MHSNLTLLLDVGATKMEYLIVDGTTIVANEELPSCNFAFSTNEDALRLIPYGNAIKAVFLFGAGINSDDIIHSVKDVIHTLFTSAKQVKVTNDVDLAALAFADSDKCIVGILGTGSNATLSHRGKVQKRLLAGGHLLGDQASGYALGKEVLKRYLEGRLDPSSECLFIEMFGITRREIVSTIYANDNPKRFIASFTPFIKTLPVEAQKIILDHQFNQFFENVWQQIPQSKSMTFNFVGSVAYHFGDDLRTFAREHNITIGQTIQRPLENYALIIDQLNE